METAETAATVEAVVAVQEGPLTAFCVLGRQRELATPVRTHSTRLTPLPARAVRAENRWATSGRLARMVWSDKSTPFPDRLNLYGFRPWRLTRRDSSVSRFDAGSFWPSAARTQERPKPA